MKGMQLRLEQLGFDPGSIDGRWGPMTEAAFMALAAAYEARLEPADEAPGCIPLHWMPPCYMQRIILHWTGGAYTANATDREHYHILIEGDGKLVQGDFPISANVKPVRGAYAAHTFNCNTKSIGVSLCAMGGAVEAPFDAGPYPVTAKQYEVLIGVLVALCARYRITPDRTGVLSHAEVQSTLRIRQNQKWDIARLPFEDAPVGAHEIGDAIRAQVSALKKPEGVA